LNGKLDKPKEEKIRDIIRKLNDAEQREEVRVEIIEKSLHIPELIQLVKSESILPNNEKVHELFWKENYRFSTKPKTNKEAAEQVEWLMRIKEDLGHVFLRPRKNSRTFFTMGHSLMSSVEEHLLYHMGFEIINAQDK